MSLGEWQCGRCKAQDSTENPVEDRYSYGFYAGRFCEKCARSGYRDQCGLGPEGQGDPTTLDEFLIGGWDAIYGEEGGFF